MLDNACAQNLISMIFVIVIFLQTTKGSDELIFSSNPTDDSNLLFQTNKATITDVLRDMADSEITPSSRANVCFYRFYVSLMIYL